MAPNCPVAATASNAASELTACCQPLRPTQQNLGSSRRSCNLQAGNVSTTPSDESAAFASTMAHARSKTLQPSALAAASRAESPTQFGQRGKSTKQRQRARLPQLALTNAAALASTMAQRLLKRPSSASLKQSSPPQPPKLAPFNGFRVCPQTPGRLTILAALFAVVFSYGDRRATARKRKLRTCSRCRKIKIVFRNQSIRRTRFLFQRHRDAFFSLEPSFLALHRIAPRSAPFDQAARPRRSRKRCFFPSCRKLLSFASARGAQILESVYG